MSIINSLLDQDFYKFSMGQVALHQFPWVNVEYEFKCRNNNIKWTKEQVGRIRYEILEFCNLRFYDSELCFLSKIRFFKQSYIDFLRLYKPSACHVDVSLDENHQLSITIKGPWFLTIYFEVPVLAIVNEVYFENIYGTSSKERNSFYCNGKQKLVDKISVASNSGFPFADFGTRRRFSCDWHRQIIEYLKKHSSTFIGTSNVKFAQEFNVKPIGTMAHELFMIGQAIDVPLVCSQKKMLQAWADEYRGDLGIALTDTIGIDAFLKDFDLYFAKLYDGLRHDSGQPDIWADKVIKHYESLGIDPRTKKLVFSNGLDFHKASEIFRIYKDKAQVSFGIGTNLTNDFDSVEPLQIVMKIVKCNGKPVAKISDSPGKGMCKDDEFVSYLKKVFGI